MGRLLKGRGSQKTCLGMLLFFLRGTERVTATKGLRKLGAALQAFFSLKGFFFNKIDPPASSS
jgi:hypothetical protein